MECTMVDGKATNALVENRATLRCPVCTLTFKNYKFVAPGTFDHSKIQKNHLKLCLAGLHSQFKLFEFLLEIHRRQEKAKLLRDNKNISSAELKIKMDETKQIYIKEIWKLIKSKIDIVKPGYGTSNTGPNIKRCLEKPGILAKILNIDQRFVEKICFVSKCFQSRSKPESSKWFEAVDFIYQKFMADLSDLMSMPPSVHKILIHGFEIIQSFDKGPFYYSEEAQEAINKKFRSVRLNNARKNSFKNMTYDVANYFYVSTDPIVNNAKIS